MGEVIDLPAPVTILKGVKNARAGQLAKLGVINVEDIYTLYPVSYEDRSAVRKICELRAGEQASVCAYVRSSASKRINAGVTVTNVNIYDETGSMSVSIFTGRYQAQPLRTGELYAFYGKITEDGYGKHIINPAISHYDGKWDADFFSVQPVYPLTKGLTQNMMRRIAAEALRAAPPSYETVPKSILRKYGLPGRAYAVRNVHFPESAAAAGISRRRFKFEELFTMQLMLLLAKRASENSCGGIRFDSPEGRRAADELIRTLPFELSEGQKSVWSEISANMESPAAMNRLVLGDVGSGKTVLAVLAMLKAVKCGCQAVYMAPTEILAEQHYENIRNMLAPCGVRVILITGSLGAKEKREALSLAESGEAQCIIGTHALIQPSVRYKKLGLAVTDEQHRFGVKQRAMLAEQGNTPDVLVMTATPIPRTLALILYGDMDISVLKTLPRGRQPVRTYALEDSMHERIYDMILRLTSEGRQVYMVYPLIESGDDPSLRSAEESFAELSKTVFRGVPCGLIHGKMSSGEKDAVMRDFKENRIKILFATTVVEVGVDVPNASLMVIENAERFGLAQLHQLRGRVGRGPYRSYCVLFSGKITERMKIMESVSDGFTLSEKDLELRGPGDFFGVEQHGLPPLKIANLYEDADILAMSTQAAGYVLGHMSEYEDYINYIKRLYPGRIPL